MTRPRTRRHGAAVGERILCGVAAFLAGYAAIRTWVPEDVAVGMVLALLYLAVTLAEARLDGRGRP